MVIYNYGTYNTPRPISSVAAQDKVPSVYSLGNFGSILYAMTSADGRLLMWDPGGVVAPGQVTAIANGAFTASSPIIYLTTLPALIASGQLVFDLTTSKTLGSVLSIAADNHVIAALGAFPRGALSFTVSVAAPPRVIPGMIVTDTTVGVLVGKISAYTFTNNTIPASGPWTTSNSGIPMNVANPGWILPGMTVADNTTSQSVGTVLSYTGANSGVSFQPLVPFTTSTTKIPMSTANPGWVTAGMRVIDNTTGFRIGTVASFSGGLLTLAAPALHASSGSSDALQIGDYTINLTAPALNASAGATDSLHITGNVITLAQPSVTASAGNNDALLISGGAMVTLTANSAFASGGSSDELRFSGNVAVVQPPTTGRGPVPLGRGFVVTNERYIMIYGTADDGTPEGGKQNRFAWCDQENPGAWDYSNITSQAGFLDIEPASPIICASATRNGVILFTAKKAYNSQYLGMPYIYNYVELGENCTPWSPQSISNTSSMTVWVSKQGAFSYDGTRILPMNCLVRPWVDDDIDLLQVREQACLVHVGDFNEVWWFFPQDGLTKNTRCIIYSYKEGWWSMGRMARTAGITSSYTAHTIMADDLIAYQHEVPSAYPANIDLPWAETYDLNLNSGATLTTVKQLIPDIDGAVANVLYSLFYRMSRSVGVDANGNVIVAPELQTPPSQVRPNGYVDFRVTGRDIRLKIEIGAPPGQPRPDVRPVTVGQHLIDSVPRGDR